jgi:hypothetical protein
VCGLSCFPLQYKSYLLHCLSLTAKTETNELKSLLTMVQLWSSIFTTFSILHPSRFIVSSSSLDNFTTCYTITTQIWKQNEIVTGQKMYKLMDVFYRHTKITHIPTCYSSELDQRAPGPTSWRSSLIIFFYLHHVFIVLFSSVSLPKTCMHYSFPLCVLHDLPISLFFIWSSE